MRTLDADLLAAQNAGSGEPAIFLQIEDRPLAAERIAPVAPACPDRGRNNLARVATPDGLHVLVVYPDATGQLQAYFDNLQGAYTGVASLGAGHLAQQAPSLGLVHLGGAYQLFYVGTDGRTVWRASSADGVTWSARVLVVQAPVGTGVRALSATVAGGLAVVAYATDPGGAGDDRINVVFDDAGWQGPFTYPDTFETITSLDADGVEGDADGTAQLVFTTSHPTNGRQGLHTLAFANVSRTFGARGDLFHTAEGAGVTLSHASILASNHGGQSRALLAWLASVAGATRPWFLWTGNANLVTVPVPFEYTAYGNNALKLVQRGSLDALVGTSQTYYWERFDASRPEHRRDDLGQYVRSFHLEQAEDRGGKLEIALDDEGLRFLSAGGLGSPWQALRRGSSLTLGFGYRLPGGPKYAYSQGWQITAVRRRLARAKGKGATAELVIEAADPPGWLAAATHVFTWYRENVTNAEVFGHCLNAIAGYWTYPWQARNSRVNARVCVLPGQSYGHLLRRVIDELGHRLAIASGSTPDAHDFAVALLDYDAAVPALHLGGSGETPLLACEHFALDEQANHVSVQGRGATGQGWDATAILAHNQVRTKRHDNQNLTTDADCNDVAERMALRLANNRARTEVTTPYQLEAEVGDPVLLTEQTYGLSHRQRWIRRLVGRYDAGRGIYQSEITLQGSE